MDIKIPELEEIKQQLKEILAYIRQQESKNEEDELMNTKQAAKFLHLKPNTLYQRKTIPRFKKMGRVHFLKSQLKEWALQNGNVEETASLKLTRTNKAS